VITSISPSSATFGEVITITGDFFHPLLANNTVQVGNASATIISATRTQLRATINNGSSICSANNSCNTVNVIVGDRVAESNAFSLKKPVITSISPLPLGNPGLVTITGEFFSPGPDNYVNLNDYRLAASFNSSTSITVDMTRHVLSDNNPIFSSERMDSLWVSVGDADPTHPESLYSNAIDVQVNYVGPWTQMNNFTGGHRATPMTFSINNKAYLVGGFFSPGMFSSEVWEYTADTDTWRRLADFPGGTRWAGVSFAHNVLGYIGMGEGDNGLYKDVWEFDPVTEVWTRLADFPGEARKSAFSFTTGGLTYVGGGDNETPTAPLDFWAFEPTSKTWTSRQDLPKPFFSALAFNTNTGGYVAELPELWNYNPSTNSWTQKASPGLSPISAHIYKATGLGQYDRGFIFSGTSDYFYMYDPYQDNWTPLVSIGSPGYGRTSFTIGQLFYYGLGRRGNGTVTSEIYQLDISKYPN
jgi:N-acetylneuraminic acid mutarotase